MASEEDSSSLLTCNGTPVDELRVMDIKRELDDRGLSKSGSKTQLTERLKAQLLLEKLQQDAAQSSGDEGKVPNIAIQKDKAGQNEFVRQYLQQQQRNLEIQMEVKKQVEDERKRKSADESSADESNPNEKTNPALAEPEVTSPKKFKDDESNAQVAPVKEQTRMPRVARKSSRNASKAENGQETEAVKERSRSTTPEAENIRERTRSGSSSSDRSPVAEKSRRGRKGRQTRVKATRGVGRRKGRQTRKESSSPSSSPEEVMSKKKRRTVSASSRSRSGSPHVTSPDAPTRRSNRKASATVRYTPDHGADVIDDKKEESPVQRRSSRRKASDVTPQESQEDKPAAAAAPTDLEKKEDNKSMPENLEALDAAAKGKETAVKIAEDYNGQKIVKPDKGNSENGNEPKVETVSERSEEHEEEKRRGRRDGKDTSNVPEKKDPEQQMVVEEKSKDKVGDEFESISKNSAKEDTLKKQDIIKESKEQDVAKDNITVEEESKDSAQTKQDLADDKRKEPLHSVEQEVAKKKSEDSSRTEQDVVKDNNEGSTEVDSHVATDEKKELAQEQDVEKENNKDITREISRSLGEENIQSEEKSISGSRCEEPMETNSEQEANPISNEGEQLKDKKADDGSQKDHVSEKEEKRKVEEREPVQMEENIQETAILDKTPNNDKEQNDRDDKSQSDKNNGEKLESNNSAKNDSSNSKNEVDSLQDKEEEKHDSETRKTFRLSRWKSRGAKPGQKTADSAPLKEDESKIVSKPDEERLPDPTVSNLAAESSRIETDVVREQIDEGNNGKGSGKRSVSPDDTRKGCQRRRRSASSSSSSKSSSRSRSPPKKKRNRSDSSSSSSRSRSKSKSSSSDSSTEEESKGSKRKGSVAKMPVDKKADDSSNGIKPTVKERLETAAKTEETQSKQQEDDAVDTTATSKSEADANSMTTDTRALKTPDILDKNQDWEAKDGVTVTADGDADGNCKKEKVAKRRKWGSKTSKAAKVVRKPTSIEISSDSLKGLIGEVKMTETVFDVETELVNTLDYDEQDDDRRDIKMKRTVVQGSPKSEEAIEEEAEAAPMEEDARQVEDTGSKIETEDGIEVMEDDARCVESKEDVTTESVVDTAPPIEPEKKIIRLVSKEGLKKKLKEKEGKKSKKKKDDGQADRKENKTDKSPKPEPKKEKVIATHRPSKPLVQQADEPERVSESKTPAKFPVSCVLKIIGLVRPFTLGQLKELLKRTGDLDDTLFWINSIKSECLAVYASEDDAVKTRAALQGTRWPSSNPKILDVDFATIEEVKHRQGGGIGPVPVNRLVSRDEPNQPLDKRNEERDRRTKAREQKEKEREDREKEEREKRDIERQKRREAERKNPVREWDRDKVHQLSRSRSRSKGREEDRSRRSRDRACEKEDRKRRDRSGEDRKDDEKKKEKKPKAEEEPPAKLLDDLFRKTKATPCIYWLPLTEEQAQLQQTQREEKEKERQKRLAAIEERHKEEEKKREAARQERIRDREKERNRERNKEKERERDSGRDRGRQNRDRSSKSRSSSRSRSRRRR